MLLWCHKLGLVAVIASILVSSEVFAGDEFDQCLYVMEARESSTLPFKVRFKYQMEFDGEVFWPDTYSGTVVQGSKASKRQLVKNSIRIGESDWSLEANRVEVDYIQVRRPRTCTTVTRAHDPPGKVWKGRTQPSSPDTGQTPAQFGLMLADRPYSSYLRNSEVRLLSREGDDSLQIVRVVCPVSPEDPEHVMLMDLSEPHGYYPVLIRFCSVEGGLGGVPVEIEGKTYLNYVSYHVDELTAVGASWLPLKGRYVQYGKNKGVGHLSVDASSIEYGERILPTDFDLPPNSKIRNIATGRIETVGPTYDVEEREFTELLDMISSEGMMSPEETALQFELSRWTVFGLAIFGVGLGLLIARRRSSRSPAPAPKGKAC